jgi:allophanate hydrolase
VEVWRLTPDGFGRFVAAIPSPLGIGSISLSDGTEVKGFLVEAAAISGAADITGYGGWRSYVEAGSQQKVGGAR